MTKTVDLESSEIIIHAVYQREYISSAALHFQSILTNSEEIHWEHNLLFT